jgi:ADP-dependent NAD(P)H-hydrate dehydratase / NAD(P)H-hydrate epimerase
MITNQQALSGDLAPFLNGPELWRALLPSVSNDVHKYQRGHCLVVSGSEFQTGASRLAAIAALNNGAGAVTIAGDAAALRIHAAHLTAIMLAKADNPEDFAALVQARRFDAVIIGPAAGVGATTFARIQAARKAGLRLVLDADALTSLVGQMSSFRDENSEFPLSIMTPHQGEFAELFAPILTDDMAYKSLPVAQQVLPLEQARAAARLSNAVIVLKGNQTIIASPDGRAAINTNAGPELATAGSGDVLSGLMGAHLAGGMPAFEAAAAAVWLHGNLGTKIGIGLTADRLVATIKPLAAFI